MLRRKGFTLAEVLIALLLVGILSSISIQTLRNRDNSAEYEALRNKAVTNIQGVMHESLFTAKSSEIFKENFTEVWDNVDKRLSTKTGSIKSKDGTINIPTSHVMRDGVNYAYTQKEGNSQVAEITIDVNGSKAPNEEGKDIFKYNMDKFGGLLLATIPDTPDKELCPDGVTEKIDDGSNCPKCTDGSAVTTPDRSNCPKCPNGTTEKNADGSNCDKCANGEIANADRSNCPKCGIQTIEANATRSNCPRCPELTIEKTDVDGSNCPTIKCESNGAWVYDIRECCTHPAFTTYVWSDGSCNLCPEDKPYNVSEGLYPQCQAKKRAYLILNITYISPPCDSYKLDLYLSETKDGKNPVTDNNAYGKVYIKSNGGGTSVPGPGDTSTYVHSFTGSWTNSVMITNRDISGVNCYTWSDDDVLTISGHDIQSDKYEILY